MDNALVGALLVLLGVVSDRVLSWIEKGCEQRRQRRALTKVILIEIDTFYRYHFRDPSRFLESTDPRDCELPVVKSLEPDLFPVYKGNTARLAEFDEDAAESIVRFYEAAKSHVSTLRGYKAARERFLRGESVDVSETEARTLLGQMKNALPELTKLTYLVCSQLCRITGVQFQSPRIAVAAENLSVEEIARSLQSNT